MNFSLNNKHLISNFSEKKMSNEPYYLSAPYLDKELPEGRDNGSYFEICHTVVKERSRFSEDADDQLKKTRPPPVFHTCELSPRPRHTP